MKRKKGSRGVVREAAAKFEWWCFFIGASSGNRGGLFTLVPPLAPLATPSYLAPANFV